MATSLRFHTAEQLGPKQRFVNGGYLLCEDVPIARVGTLLYAAGEVPVTPTADGIVSIVRDAEDVFAQRAIDSFQGAPITDDHPTSDGQVIEVEPENWKTHSIGIVLNPRRGSHADGTDSDFLYADLLVQDGDAIRAVREGKREVSAGYDAEYQELAPGRGRQRNIVGNHVALVDRGRCGPRCAIGDSDVVLTRVRGSAVMAARTQVRDTLARVRDRIARMRRATRDEDFVQELDKVDDMLGDVISGDEMPDDMKSHHITVNVNGSGANSRAGLDSATNDDDTPAGDTPADGDAGAGGDIAAQLADIQKRLANVEETLVALAEAEAAETEGGEEDSSGAGADAMGGDAEPVMEDRVGRDRGVRAAQDRRARVGDSSSLSAAFTDMLAKAEILAPGVSTPTFDAASAAVRTVDAMCGFRRRVLREAYATADAKIAIDAFLAGAQPNFHDVRAMTCDRVSAVFDGAATLLTQQRQAAGALRGSAAVNGFSGKAPSARELNEKFAQYRTSGQRA